MIVDDVHIIVTAGHGGDGKMHYYPAEKAGPDGGTGGKGGDVYLQATSDLSALQQFSGKKIYKGENGQPGGNNQKRGRGGKDMTLKIPIGSTITDEESGKIWELNNPDRIICICNGGEGGKGNYELRSSRLTTPMYAESGKRGQQRKLHINLRFIAEFGFIGLPNAGKSSLLNALTAAQAKVGNYPFTTLEASLGVFNHHILADIPGLIEGASTGKGLGIRFLKHIEKVSWILHCIGADSPHPVEDYQIIQKEMAAYNQTMLQKPEIILLTKSDLVTEEELKQRMEELKSLDKKIIPISIYKPESVDFLKTEIAHHFKS